MPGFVYGEDFLNNPSPDFLKRRNLVPLTRFADDDIRSMDYSSWRATEGRYEWHPEERKKMEELIESIHWEGLRTKVEIMCRGSALNVADGHHRVVALRKLGWTHVPYRWYIVIPFTPQSYRRGRLPEKEGD